MKQYTIHHAFAHDGVFYGRTNEQDVGNLPAVVIDDVVRRGLVTVVDVPDAAAAPTTGIAPLGGVPTGASSGVPTGAPDIRTVEG